MLVTNICSVYQTTSLLCGRAAWPGVPPTEDRRGLVTPRTVRARVVRMVAEAQPDCPSEYAPMIAGRAYARQRFAGQHPPLDSPWPRRRQRADLRGAHPARGGEGPGANGSPPVRGVVPHRPPSMRCRGIMRLSAPVSATSCRGVRVAPCRCPPGPWRLMEPILVSRRPQDEEMVQVHTCGVHRPSDSPPRTGPSRPISAGSRGSAYDDRRALF